jgi:hypothetical protein
MNLLPEYNEILYHAKVCSELEFREYWNEIQSELSHPVTEMVTDEEINAMQEVYKKELLEIDDFEEEEIDNWLGHWIGGARWMRDRLTQPQSDAKQKGK